MEKQENNRPRRSFTVDEPASSIENLESIDLVVKSRGEASVDIRGKVSANENGIHLQYVNPQNGATLKCTINENNPQGIGDAKACQILRDALPATKEALRGK